MFGADRGAKACADAGSSCIGMAAYCDAMQCDDRWTAFKEGYKKKRWKRGGTKRSERSLEAMLERLSIRVVRQGRERVQDG
jgi:hypothetical protein